MSLVAIGISLLLRSDWHGIDLLRVRPRTDLFETTLRLLPNILVDGISVGFLYAVIALGYTMVYGVLRFINFAHSEIFMVGGVIGFEVLMLLNHGAEGGALESLSPVLVILAMLLAAMLFSGGLAVVVERVAYKPLRNAPKLVPLISAIGVSLLLQDLVRATQELRRGAFNMPYPLDDFMKFAAVNRQGKAIQVPFLQQRVPLIGDVSTNMTTVVIVISAILMVLALNYFVNATKLGKGIRAVSQDQTTASLMGINVNQMITLTFLIGGALGGAAGVLFGLKVSNISPYIGFAPGLKAFTAAVLGGIGNITGALLGGLLLGLIEAFFSSLLPSFPALGTGYTDIFAFSVLILVLLFRPSGLLGKREDEKV
ncbi:MAG: branched-chain amino acid ABC transporter permease [Anaerolineales bacterium]|nr:branched-chain amino acid ABC transporter permease [Anaerolineales bacterium]